MIKKGDKGMGQWARRGAMAWGKDMGQGLWARTDGKFVQGVAYSWTLPPPPQQNWATPQHKPLYF